MAMSHRPFVFSGESRADCLRLSIEIERVVPHLAPPAGLLVASEGHRRVENVIAIDPDGSGPQLLSHAVCLADIACPDGCREAVVAIVGARNNFLGVGE